MFSSHLETFYFIHIGRTNLDLSRYRCYPMSQEYCIHNNFHFNGKSQCKLFTKHFQGQVNSRATPAPCVRVQAHTQILHTHKVRQNENLPSIYTLQYYNYIAVAAWSNVSLRYILILQMLKCKKEKSLSIKEKLYYL